MIVDRGRRVDGGHDAPAVTVTGAAGVAIRWYAVVQGSEGVY